MTPRRLLLSCFLQKTILFSRFSAAVDLHHRLLRGGLSYQEFTRGSGVITKPRRRGDEPSDEAVGRSIVHGNCGVFAVLHPRWWTKGGYAQGPGLCKLTDEGLRIYYTEHCICSETTWGRSMRPMARH